MTGVCKLLRGDAKYNSLYTRTRTPRDSLDLNSLNTLHKEMTTNLLLRKLHKNLRLPPSRENYTNNTTK